jgi:hypothetical protein
MLPFNFAVIRKEKVGRKTAIVEFLDQFKHERLAEVY